MAGEFGRVLRMICSASQWLRMQTGGNRLGLVAFASANGKLSGCSRGVLVFAITGVKAGPAHGGFCLGA